MEAVVAGDGARVDVRYLSLVGGLSTSPYLVSRLEQASLILPQLPILSLVEGAAYMGITDGCIKAHGQMQGHLQRHGGQGTRHRAAGDGAAGQKVVHLEESVAAQAQMGGAEVRRRGGAG